MKKLAKAIAVSLSTFITANATTVVHLGEENKYFEFDVEEQGNTYTIKQAYVLKNAPLDEVILDIPGKKDGKQVVLASRSFFHFGIGGGAVPHRFPRTTLRFSRVDGIGAKLPDNCSNLFELAMSLEDIDFHNVDATHFVTNMSDMFWSCRNLKKVDFGDLNTSNVTNMSRLFCCCFGLREINYGNFVTNNVTNMCFMFAGCIRLPGEAVNNLNTQNVRNMRCMFRMTGLRHLNFGANFLTDNVTDMSGMFSENRNLLELDISGFNTQRVTNMSNMFENCGHITKLNLKHLNTSELRNIQGLFKGCKSLQELILPSQGFRQDIQGADNSMFAGCYNLAHNSEIKYQDNQAIDLGQMSVDNINRLHD